MLSNRGLCPVCGERRMTEAVLQQHRRSGPIYDKQVAARRKAAARAVSSG